jgi:transcription elongation factor Elf1
MNNYSIDLKNKVINIDTDYRLETNDLLDIIKAINGITKEQPEEKKAVTKITPEVIQERLKDRPVIRERIPNKIEKDEKQQIIKNNNFQCPKCNAAYGVKILDKTIFRDIANDIIYSFTVEGTYDYDKYITAIQNNEIPDIKEYWNDFDGNIRKATCLHCNHEDFMDTFTKTYEIINNNQCEKCGGDVWLTRVDDDWVIQCGNELCNYIRKKNDK